MLSPLRSAVQVRPAPIAALFLLLLAGACRSAGEGGAAAPAEDAVATIAGEAVPRAEFEAYVADLLRTESEEPAEESPELMSRLLDRFLDEELVVREARRRGMDVAEREVTEALRKLQSPENAEASRPPEEQARSRERMRRSLVMRKFREEEILKGLSVGQDEIGVYYDAHRDEFQQPARLVLRQIMVEDAAEAKTIHDDLVRDPSRFQEIAEKRSVAPDAGRPRAYAEADLPSEVVAAVSAVPVGRPSEVVSNREGSRIFLVDSRQPERLVGVEEASDQIRFTLLQEKGRQAYDSYIGRLREQAGLVIHEEKISFPYRRRSS